MRIEYKLQEWNGGKVWVEEAYPNILFAKDGEIYDIAGMKTIVIGGAYSVDKFYRLSKGYNWFEDEQPSDEIKAYVEKQLSNNDWNVDVVLSHTVPYDYRPVDLFLSMIDQSTVDESTELWLGEIEKKLDYKWWYAGHYHTSRVSHKADEERIKSLEAKILKGGSDEERAVKAIAEVKEYLEIVAGSRVKNTRVY